MTIFPEKTGVSLLAGAQDAEGDTLSIYRVNGTVVSSWPHAVGLPQGTVRIYQTGQVEFDDGGDTSGQPGDGATLSNGTFSFTVWDGAAESPAYTGSVSLFGVANPAYGPLAFGTRTVAGGGATPSPAGSSALTSNGGTGLSLQGSMLVAGSGSLNAGTLTFANGTTAPVTTFAGFSAATKSEVSAALGAAGAGEVVLARASVTDAQLSLSNMSKSNVVLTQEAGATFRKITCTNISGIAFDGLAFVDHNTANANPNSSNAMLVVSGGSNVEVRNSTFDGQHATSYDKYLPATYVNQQSTLYAHANYANHVWRFLTTGIGGTGGNTCIIHSNIINNHVEQAIRIADPAANGVDIQSNQILTSISRHGKRLYGNISGSINVGDSIVAGSGNNKMGGQVMGVGSNHVDLRYNAHEFPQNALYTGPNGTISVTSKDAAYDPVHSDGIQIFNPGANYNITIKLKRNLIGRGAEPVADYPAVTINDAYPAIRIQDQAGGGYGYIYEMEQNVLFADHLEAMDAAAGKGGYIKNNLCFSSSKTAVDQPCRMRVYGNNMTITGNAGDSANTGPGIIVNGSGNAVSGNVELAWSAYASQLPNLNRDQRPHTIASFTPAAGSAMANAGAGPIDTGGNWRPLS